MPDPVATPLPSPVRDQNESLVPPQANSSPIAPDALVGLPEGTKSITVTDGRVEYVAANGQQQMATATATSPIKVNLEDAGLASALDKENARLAKDINRAQRDIVKNISLSLKNSMKRIEIAYLLNLGMNLVVFGIGIVSFVLAAVAGLGHPSQREAIVSGAFGGLSAIVFLGFFISRPMAAVGSSGAKLAWLLATVNTYWTKLIYMNENEKVLEDLQHAQEQFEASMGTYLTTIKEFDGKDGPDLNGTSEAAPETGDSPAPPAPGGAS